MKLIIHRLPKSRRDKYVSVHLSALEDPRLTTEAKFVHMYAMSRPGGWNWNKTDVRNRVRGMGRDSLYNAIRLLIECGYAERVQNQEDHRFTGMQVHFYEVPKAMMPAESEPLPEKPVTGKPYTGMAGTGKPDTYYPPSENGPSGQSHREISPSYSPRGTVPGPDAKPSADTEDGRFATGQAFEDAMAQMRHRRPAKVRTEPEPLMPLEEWEAFQAESARTWAEMEERKLGIQREGARCNAKSVTHERRI